MAFPTDTRPRALLTGYNGFTGRYIARELESAGYQVIGLVTDQDVAVPGSLRANLLDRHAVREAVELAAADVVVHLAAISFVAHGDAEEIYRVNIVGTRNLLDALSVAAHAPRLVVLASSANVYGNAQDDPITEDTPLAPANDYAVSKSAMEQMARLWMDRLPIVIVRPFNYTGAGQSERFLIPKIVSHFRRHAPFIELGNIHVWRDFSDVRDVAKAYAAIVRVAPAGEIFNICSGRAYSLSDVLDFMSQIAGHRMEVRINQAFVRSNEVARLVGSGERLAAAVGTWPLVQLPETLQWMYTTS